MCDSQYKHLLSMSNQIIRFFNQTADIYERDMLDMANKSILFGSADQNHNAQESSEEEIGNYHKAIYVLIRSKRSRFNCRNEYFKFYQFIEDNFSQEQNTDSDQINSSVFYDKFITTSFNFITKCCKNRTNLETIIKLINLYVCCLKSIESESYITKNSLLETNLVMIKSFCTYPIFSTTFKVVTEDIIVDYSVPVFSACLRFLRKLIVINPKESQDLLNTLFAKQYNGYSIINKINTYLNLKAGICNLVVQNNNLNKTNSLNRFGMSILKNNSKKVIKLIKNSNPKCYYTSLSSERESILFLKYLLNDNKDIKVTLRKISRNSKVQSSVLTTLKYIDSLGRFLNYKYISYLYLRTLELILEFIQGSSVENQKTLMKNKFHKIAEMILSIKPFDVTKKINFEDYDIISDKLESNKFLKKFNRKNKHPKNASIHNKFFLELMRYRVLIIINELMQNNEENSFIFIIFKQMALTKIFDKNLIWQRELKRLKHAGFADSNELFKSTNVTRYAVKCTGNEDNLKDKIPFIYEIPIQLYIISERLGNGAKEDKSKFATFNDIARFPSFALRYYLTYFLIHIISKIVEGIKVKDLLGLLKKISCKRKIINRDLPNFKKQLKESILTIEVNKDNKVYQIQFPSKYKTINIPK